MKSKMLRTAAGVALALAGVVLSAGAQSNPGPDPTMVPVLKAEFDRAAKQNVPAAPLIATARHGMIMGQPTNKIRDAVRGKADRYVTAREALAPVQSESELQAGADALQQNISRSTLQSLRKAHPSRSLTMSIGVLQVLISKGVPPKQALATIEQLLKRNESDTRIASLGTDLQGMLAEGLAPSRAFEAISKGVLSLPQSPGAGSAALQRK